MRYEKPELVLLGLACVAVQNQLKGMGPFVDITLQNTIGAYEADE